MAYIFFYIKNEQMFGIKDFTPSYLIIQDNMTKIVQKYNILNNLYKIGHILLKMVYKYVLIVLWSGGTLWNFT